MTNRVRTALESAIAADLPDNTTQSITASSLRSACTDMNDTIFRSDAIALSDKTGRILLQQGGYLLKDFTAEKWTTTAQIAEMWAGDSFDLVDGVERTATNDGMTLVMALKVTGTSNTSIQTFSGDYTVSGSTWTPLSEIAFTASGDSFNIGTRLNEYYAGDFETAGTYRDKWVLLLYSSSGATSHVYTVLLNGDGTETVLTTQSYNNNLTNYRYHVAGKSWVLGAVSTQIENDDDISFSYVGCLPNYYIDFSVEANRRKFVSADGWLVQPDESAWSQWGGTQPLVWAADGDLSNNAGSLANFTNNGMASAPDSPTD